MPLINLTPDVDRQKEKKREVHFLSGWCDNTSAIEMFSLETNFNILQFLSFLCTEKKKLNQQHQSN